MKKSYELAIIGGGIIGCAIAYELALRGMKNIIVLERQYLTFGATGRCGAGVRQQWGTETNAILAKESVKKFERMNEELEYKRDIEFKQKGYLLCAYSEAEWEQFTKNVTLQRRLGIDVKMLDPQGAKEIVPHLNIDGMIGATFCGTDGHANPFYVTEAYAQAAKRLGVTFETFTEVTGIELKDDSTYAVQTTKGNIATPLVVNATGFNAGVISQMIGAELPVYSERHQALVTEPVEALQSPMVISFQHHIYCQQTPHGSFVMGWGDPNEPVSFNVQSSWHFLEEMAQRVTAILPILKKIRLIRQWAGLYDMSSDANPILDEIPGFKGFYVAAGFSGYCVLPYKALGELQARQYLFYFVLLPFELL